MNKKDAEILLSSIQVFHKPKVLLEQYPADAIIAAEVLWTAFLRGHVKGKVVGDLGCGPGIFGIGALLFGAKAVHFVDIDKEALDCAKENLQMIQSKTGQTFHAYFHCANVKDFYKKLDVVIQNPPFGVKDVHHDQIFLLKAMDLAPVVYSFHKLSTKEFVDSYVQGNGWSVFSFTKYKFPLRRSLWFHVSRISYVDVGGWCIVKSLQQKKKGRAM